MPEERPVPLSELTTMRVGGAPSALRVALTADELIEIVRDLDANGERLLLVSGGSNLLVADAGFEGTVVRVGSRGITLGSADLCGGVIVTVAAGESWDDFVSYCVEQGWAGIEALSGIPGLVGATPIQNVGAYGQEVAQTIWSVRVWDRADRAVRTFANADCGFAYRTSRFKGADRYVVLDVTFQLEVADLSRPIAYGDLAAGLGVELGARVPLARAREAVLEQRRRRGMVLDDADHDTWSCGSFFTNPILTPGEYESLTLRVREHLGSEAIPPRFPAGVPGAPEAVKTSAAWLIDRAGFAKGYGLPGPAALSTKHVLALTNRGGASAEELIALARRVRDGVRDVFDVELVNEPVLVGLEL